MLPLDRYRAAAKRQAWYDDDEETPNYNPFRKIRTRSKHPYDEENPALRVPTNRSENYATPSIEAQRRSKNLEEIDIPKHADTMPSSSGPASSKSPVNGPASDVKDMANDGQSGGGHEREKQFSQDSDPVSSETIVDSEVLSNGKARRWKFPFIGKKSKAGDDLDSEKPRRQSSLFRNDPQKFTAMGQLRATLLNSWINVLLIFVPIGIAVNYAGIPKVGVFVINFIAIIPLAAMLSYATEEIALRVGETLGGLLNATFGYFYTPGYALLCNPLIRC